MQQRLNLIKIVDVKVTLTLKISKKSIIKII